MDGLIKWIGKTSVSAVIWVFVLSISWNGKTFFSYANDVLVKNSVVQAIDGKLAEIWNKMSHTAKANMNGERAKEKI